MADDVVSVAANVNVLHNMIRDKQCFDSGYQTHETWPSNSSSLNLSPSVASIFAFTIRQGKLKYDYHDKDEAYVGC